MTLVWEKATSCPGSQGQLAYALSLARLGRSSQQTLKNLPFLDRDTPVRPLQPESARSLRRFGMRSRDILECAVVVVVAVLETSRFRIRRMECVV